MKVQFGTATLMSTVAFCAIALGGILAAWRLIAEPRGGGPTIVQLLGGMLALSPWWCPLVFTGYLVGRQQVTARAIVVFAALEVLALCGLAWMMSR
jgi:hypothetical protein